MPGYFVLTHLENDSYEFSLKTERHTPILRSGLCATKADAETGILLVQRYASIKSSFRRASKVDFSVYFELVEPSGQVLATSMTFTSMYESEAAIRSVMRCAPSARLIQGVRRE
jgi:uncharacterized protein YegP (UPF0339 family)